MRKLTEEELNKEWVTFWGNMEKCGLSTYFPNEKSEKLRADLSRASCALTEDTGVSFPGALLLHINLLTAIAKKMAKMISGTFNIDEYSLLKVCCLQHLSKIEMYIENPDEWYRNKRGQNYVFADLPGRLKFGERSILLATNNGITFTPEEWEAMECMDKAGESEGTSGAGRFDCILSTIVRQANELAYAIEKERHKKGIF